MLFAILTGGKEEGAVFNDRRGQSGVDRAALSGVKELCAVLDGGSGVLVAPLIGGSVDRGRVCRNIEWCDTLWRSGGVVGVVAGGYSSGSVSLFINMWHLGEKVLTRHLLMHWVFNKKRLVWWCW